MPLKSINPTKFCDIFITSRFTITNPEMKSIIVLLVCVAYANALVCWSCENVDSYTCSRFGKPITCKSNEHSCIITERRNGNAYLYWKGCKEGLACTNNEIQNPRAAATPSQCNEGAPSSVCRCCCATDNCTRDTDDCSNTTITTKSDIVTTSPRTPPPEILCDPPPYVWLQGDIECGSSLRSDGKYPLRHKCDYICDSGTEIEGGAKNFTTCRLSSLNPGNPNIIPPGHPTVWLPPPPNCVPMVPDDTCIAEPFWDPRTPGPVGIINCFGESSPFEIDYQCAYECPSNHTLVGPNTTVCTRSRTTDALGNEVILDRFVPPNPCCEPDGCSINYNVLFVLDRSTSVDEDEMKIMTNFIADITSRTSANPNMLYGVITFGKDVFTTEGLQIKFSEFSENLITDMKAITPNPNRNSNDEGTNSPAALNWASTNVFGDDTQVFNRNPDYGNLVFFITDGVSTIRSDQVAAESRTLNDLATVVAVGIGLNSLKERRNQERGQQELFIIADNKTQRYLGDIADFNALQSVDLNATLNEICPKLCNGTAAEDPPCIAEPEWRPDSPGTPGTVDCNGLTSPYEIGAVCDYRCPPDHETIGPSNTICTVFRDDNGNGIFSDFVPPNPCCEPNGCSIKYDILFILDRSTSINETEMEIMTELVAGLAGGVAETNPTMQFGVVTFGNKVYQTPGLKIKFQTYSEELGREILRIPPNPSQSVDDEGTHTAEVLEWVNTRVLGSGEEADEENFGNSDKPNLVFFFTDGVSTKGTDQVGTKAETLNNLATVVSIGIGLEGLINEKRGKEEVATIGGNNTDHIIDDLNFEDVSSLTKKFTEIFTELCPKLCEGISS